MKASNTFRTSVLWSLAIIWFLGLPCIAERGFVLMQVQDTRHHPVRGVEIGVEGNGSSQLTGDDGKARLAVGAAAKEGDWLTLMIARSPAGQDLVMISPWDLRAQIPSFDDKPENFVRVVVVQRGDRAALEDGSVLASITAKINQANSPKTVHGEGQSPEAALAIVAQRYGFNPDDLDRMIRTWGQKTTDPYEAGLAALYQRNYPKASADLQNSLQQRENQLTADREKLSQDADQVADAACFLGDSLYREGKYRESARAYDRCLQIRTNYPAAITGLGLSLMGMGNYAAAEPLLRRASAIIESSERTGINVGNAYNNLAALLTFEGAYDDAGKLLQEALKIDEREVGDNDPRTAISLYNFAELLTFKGEYQRAALLFGEARHIFETKLPADRVDLANCLEGEAKILTSKEDYAAAEPLYRKALEIRESASGPHQPDLANNLSDIASVLAKERHYDEAEPLYRRAIEIDESAFGRSTPATAVKINNLGLVLVMQGKYVAAKLLIDEALEIRMHILGSDHPEIANSLYSLATLLIAEQNYGAAEEPLRRAIQIAEKKLSPNHPDLATYLTDLGEVLEDEGKYVAAEPILRRALDIDEKTGRMNSPDTAATLFRMARAVEAGGDLIAAEGFFRRSLDIEQKVLGPDDPEVASCLSGIADTLKLRGNYAEAERLLRKALDIDTKALGEGHPWTKIIQRNLDACVMESQKRGQK
jgi:tetratricopeptide (TPR) repeat protein